MLEPAAYFTYLRSRAEKEALQETLFLRTGGKRIRLTFHSEYSQKSMISQMVLECQVPVNILYADTKELDGKPYGQMMIELPEGEREGEKVMAWLKNSCIDWQEVL